MMRLPLTLSAVIVLAACGQTGSLYLPDEGVETPVEIRTPATTPPAAPGNTPPAPVPEPEEDEQNPKDAPPPPG